MPTTKQQLDVSKGGFYEVDKKLYFVKDDGDTFELDFDLSQTIRSNGEEHAIKNKIENKSEMEDTSETTQDTSDITTQQVEENYWVETPKTKQDGSTAMMEARISACMRATGKSHEECSKEVKTRMKKQGSENTNTTDIHEEVENEELEVENEDEDTKDMAEICSKELDMLKEKAGQYDDLVKARETEKTEFKEAMDFFEKIKQERAEDQENKRQTEISKLINDFQLPKEEIENDTIEELEKTRKRIDMALNTGESEDENTAEITADMQSDFNKKVAELDAKYKVKF